MNDGHRYKHWIGKEGISGKSECPYCHSQDINEAKHVKHGGRHFTCGHCHAQNHFGRRMVERVRE
jgi:hypothetical protein